MPNKAAPRHSSSPQIKHGSPNKGAGMNITSQSIASDLVAFRKQGGRIEVLGNTPLRANVTAFSSKANATHKTPPVPTGKSAAQG